MKRIWIVDDDKDMQQAVSLMLKLLDCDVSAFGDARSAVEALLGGRLPDLLILDVNMPEVSGLDLLEFVRRRSEWKGLPVLMLSSEASDATVDQAYQTGADGYLLKPATLEELKRAMEAALQKRVGIK